MPLSKIIFWIYPLLAIVISTGCQTTTQYTTDGKPLVSKRGSVAVDAVARRALLTQAGTLSNKCRSNSIKIPVLLDIDAPEGYGLDDRYNSVSYALRASGSSCLGGNEKACAIIQRGAVDWATNSLLDKPRGGSGSGTHWNDTLTVNMRLINPLVTALGVAEAFTPMLNEDRNVVDPWLAKMVNNFEHGLRSSGRYKAGKDGASARKAAHNHAVQSSLGAMSYGAWVGDDSAFSVGLDQWNITLQSIRDDGSLPIETRRGARALFYHGRTLTALIQIAERAKVQGINLYNLPPSPEKNIHKVASFFIEAVRNPELVLGYASTNKAPGPSKDYSRQDLGGSGTLGWIAPYIAQFPNHHNTKALLTMKENESYLAQSVVSAVKNGGESVEWIGVDAKCFYAAP